MTARAMAPGASAHRLTAARALLALLLALPLTARAGVRPAYGGEVRILLPAVPQVTDPGRATEPADVALVRALHATPLELEGGRLVPGLLEEVPAAEAGGRAFRLRLRAGLRFADGTPLGASDLAATLARLAAPGAPHGWIALPILGADAVVERRAAVLAGVQLLSDRELLVTLAFPMPEWPWALAAPAAAVVSARGAGAGPFQLGALAPDAVRLTANPLHFRGRAFADALVLAASDARGGARALERGEADLVLRAEAAGAGALPTPPLSATVAVLERRRLGAGLEPVRRALSELDRAELGRLFAHGPSAPMASLVPSAVLPGTPEAAPAAAGGAPPARLTLLVLAGAPDQRAVAERLQVKLFDRGIRVVVEAEPAPRFQARLAAGEYDTALLPVAVQALAPALAAGQVALAARGEVACRRALAELSGLAPEAAAARAADLTRALDLVPLFATGLRATPGPALGGVAVQADGGLDPGDLWRRGDWQAAAAAPGK